MRAELRPRLPHAPAARTKTALWLRHGRRPNVGCLIDTLGGNGPYQRDDPADDAPAQEEIHQENAHKICLRPRRAYDGRQKVQSYACEKKRKVKHDPVCPFPGTRFLFIHTSIRLRQFPSFSCRPPTHAAAQTPETSLQLKRGTRIESTLPNHLTAEKSPYLQQHAHNPVDWYPWGDAAFAKARAEDKPIFLSVGYSTCHWCHVMERESFESDDLAAILNRWFVPVKVDREERPDVDRVYMTFVQATTGSGGWPMSVWMTPTLMPFYGGTYFPPESRWGRPGFPQLLEYLARKWKTERSKIAE